MRREGQFGLAPLRAQEFGTVWQTEMHVQGEGINFVPSEAGSEGNIFRERLVCLLQKVLKQWHES